MYKTLLLGLVTLMNVSPVMLIAWQMNRLSLFSLLLSPNRIKLNSGKNSFSIPGYLVPVLSPVTHAII